VDRPIDLRSDTVTTPTEAMRRAMSEAEVGDDWYGDDPTVNRLQERCAEATGKDAAIYVPTGTMANQIALHQHVRSGHFLICAEHSHVASVELHSSAVLSGIASLPLPAPRGRITPEQVTDAVAPDPLDAIAFDLLSLENTHNAGGGSVWPIEDLRAVAKAGRDAGLAVHLDGARIFNASVASGVPVQEYADEVDTVMFCLSKGLGAPIGSVLCGSAPFIREARKTRILFGGAWRQAGIVAAAGLIALEEGPKRLHEDHENARRLAEGIAESTPGTVDPDEVETNMVFVDVSSFDLSHWEAVARLRAEGVLSNAEAGRVRLVTHRDVTRGDIEETIAVWRRLAAEWPPAHRS
jgi:threonine aldolase